MIDKWCSLRVRRNFVRSHLPFGMMSFDWKKETTLKVREHLPENTFIDGHHGNTKTKGLCYGICRHNDCDERDDMVGIPSRTYRSVCSKDLVIPWYLHQLSIIHTLSHATDRSDRVANVYLQTQGWKTSPLLTAIEWMSWCQNSNIKTLPSMIKKFKLWNMQSYLHDINNDVCLTYCNIVLWNEYHCHMSMLAT